MSQSGQPLEKARREQAVRLALLGVIGQVGCLTLAVIVAALLAGLWLDSRFGTRPLLTLILVLGSIPVTLYLMFRLVLSAAPRLQTNAGMPARAAPKEEQDRGNSATD